MSQEKSGFTKNFGSGFIQDILLKIRLVIKLVQDDRVDLLLKAVPAFCLVYLIVPFDLLFGPLDDALVLYLGMDFFIDLCPPEIVEEHLAQLQGHSTEEDEEVIINGEFKEE